MNDCLILTRDAARRVDRLIVDELGVPSLVLMENAGRSGAELLLSLDSQLASSAGPTWSCARQGADHPAPVAILCGKGNNAGDGFVMARHLAIHGVAARCLLIAPAAQLHGDARTNYEALLRCGGAIVELAHLPCDVLAERLDRHAASARWLVDALLGTGAAGEPREPLAAAIRWMNAQPARRFALDVPSGLDCDHGEPATSTVRANATCTFVARKRGFLAPSAAPYLGQVHIASIGVSDEVVARLLDAAQDDGENGT